MTIGTKFVKGLQVGSKVIERAFMGNKSNSFSKLTPFQSALAHTANGIITNYLNSAEVAREPMKGVQIGEPKQRFQQIEKPKPRTNSKDDTFN